MLGGDWQHGDGEGDGLAPYGQSEREAAVAAAQQLLAGPYVQVPRTTWLAILALMRQAVTVLERVLVEADAASPGGSPSTSTEASADASADEQSQA
jgi:hypothetical protein